MFESLTALPTIFLFYTDPGSGALLMQLIFASVIGALFYFRKFISKVRAIFVRADVPVESADRVDRAGE